MFNGNWKFHFIACVSRRRRIWIRDDEKPLSVRANPSFYPDSSKRFNCLNLFRRKSTRGAFSTVQYPVVGRCTYPPGILLWRIWRGAPETERLGRNGEEEDLTLIFGREFRFSVARRGGRSGVGLAESV